MGAFTIYWNGTGNTIHPEFGNTSFTIGAGGKNLLLVDCGGTVPGSLYHSGELDRITDVLLTHLHADHVGALQTLAFHAHYSQQRTGTDKLRLHLATADFAQELWEHCLRGSMKPVVGFDLKPLDGTMDMFFDLHVGKTVQVDELPPVEFFPTPHVEGLENYGLTIGGRVYYSDDTVVTPDSFDWELMFHDCQFRPPEEPGVHVSYQELLDAIPRELRGKVHLVHTEPGADAQLPVNDGFAGILSPYTRFEL